MCLAVSLPHFMIDAEIRTCIYYLCFPFKVCSYRLILRKKKRRSFCIPSATHFLKFHNFAVSSVSPWRCFLCVCLFVLWWFWPMLLVSIVSISLYSLICKWWQKIQQVSFFSVLPEGRTATNQTGQSAYCNIFAKMCPLSFCLIIYIICSYITWFEI